MAMGMCSSYVIQLDIHYLPHVVYDTGTIYRTLKACSHVQGSKIFVEDITLTKGSRLTEIKNWVTQSFTPVPLQFQLSPIVNLFTKANFQCNMIGTTDPQLPNFRKWFLPMYWDYCGIVGVPCKPPTGCGYDDICPIDTICTGNGKTHECTGNVTFRISLISGVIKHCFH